MQLCFYYSYETYCRMCSTHFFLRFHVKSITLNWKLMMLFHQQYNVKVAGSGVYSSTPQRLHYHYTHVTLNQ